MVVADRPDHADANCVLFRDDAGIVHLLYVEVFGQSFCEGRVMEKTSDDDGISWSDSRSLLPAVCVMTKNKPVLLPCGRWVLPAYVQATYASWFWVSDDRGASWQAGDVLLTWPNNLQPAVVQRSDGTLFSLMRRAGDGSFTWQGESCDGGVSWTLSPREDLLNSNSGLDLIRLRNGTLVVAYDDSDTHRTPLVVRASLDEGRTWLPPRIVSDREGQQSYPTLEEAPDGTIHVVFSDDLEAIVHAEFSPAWLLGGAAPAAR